MTRNTVGVNGIDPARQGFTSTPQIWAIEDSAMIPGDRLKLWAIGIQGDRSKLWRTGRMPFAPTVFFVYCSNTFLNSTSP